MERAPHYRPRVGRETRLLITTAVLALLALWMLARLRFPTATAPETPTVAELLSARAAAADFDRLAEQISRVRGLVSPSLVVLGLDAPPAGNPPRATPGAAAALRLNGNLAVVYLPDGERLRLPAGASLVGRHAASGLAVVRLPLDPLPDTAVPRVGAPPASSQYILVTDVHAGAVALRPVFLPAVAEVDAPLWDASAYTVPADAGLEIGAFLFTRAGELAGLTVIHRGGPAVVAADVVLNEARRLIDAPLAEPVNLAIDVQDLTPPLQRALGAASGVVVTWVDPDGVAATALQARDVIEAVEGEPVPDVEHFRRRVASLAHNVPVGLQIRRQGAVLTTTIAGATGREDRREPATTPPATGLGAVTRRLPGVGAEVMSVEGGSRAQAAGLRQGDVILEIAGISAPTPAQIVRADSALRAGQTALMEVRRGSAHRLLVLER